MKKLGRIASEAAASVWRVYRFDKTGVLLSISVLAGNALQSYGTLAFTERTINAAVGGDTRAFIAPLAALAGIQLLGAGLNAFAAYRASRMHLAYANSCELESIEETGALPLAEQEHPQYEERLALRRFAATKPFEMYAQSTQLLMKLATAMLGFRYLSGVHPAVGALAVAVGCLKGGLSLMLVKRKTVMNGELQRASVRPSYLYGLLTASSAQKELTVHGSRRYYKDRWLSAKRVSDAILTRIQRMQLSAGFAGEAISAAGYAAAACAAAWAVRERGLGAGEFMAITMAMSLISSNLSAVLQSWSDVAETHAYLSESKQKQPASSILDLRRRQAVTAGQGGRPFVFNKLISIPALRYTYPNRDKPALDIGEMQIRRGEKIAILGGNGSGKSTLLKIVLGLYVPEGNPVRYDNVPVGAFGRSSMFARVHVLFQDFVRYQGTVRENMAAGHAAALTDDAKLRNSLKMAGLGELATGHGPDTPLGQIDGSSIYLSGGQWQKLALSRMFLHADAELFVLDEPTSALDPLSETALIDAIWERCADKTVLFVTHRVALARRADRVWVMEEGRIVEDGNHESLMELKARYAQVWQEQQELHNTPTL
ncbi:ATP-binding cassette domain-containing protein [Cohnella sp. GCM10020058]|uniref:ATP-binding cassette domain-containing protein n=1 Tax=Cohnella sp. GCM10020058 TaxID=3317330 RepID=UPI00362D052B